MTSENIQQPGRLIQGLSRELERLSCLAHNEEQSNHAVGTSLWSSVEVCPWSRHALSKPGIEDEFTTAVEALTDFIQN